MLNIPIVFSTDKQSKMDYKLRETIASHDVNSVRFEITFKDVDLSGKSVKVLSKYPNGSQTFVQCEIEEDKAIIKPDTNLITGSGVVLNYVYLYEGDSSLDVREFKYDTKLSEIDKSSEVIRKVYDKSYADLLADFEQALADYRDGLPSGSEIRLEIDTILNKFRLDSTAKLLEYDTQAQDMLTANQSLFVQAETDRQNAYIQSESLRDTSTSQAIADFEQMADESLDIKLGEIQTDADESLTQTVADFNDRADVAIDDKLACFESESGQILSDIVDAEVLRVQAEVDRQALIDGKADKKQEEWITPTLRHGATGTFQYRKNQFGTVEFRGDISTPNHGLEVVIIPNDYRPVTTFHAPVASGVNVNIYKLTIGASGSIFVSGSNTLLSASGIKF